MGYNTDFQGEFELNKPLHPKIRDFLERFNQTRRMKRKLPEGLYGVEGEFYVDGKGDMGQDYDRSVIDGNKPPSTQPELWCQWAPNEKGTIIQWDEGEKFYEYVEWLEYLIKKIISPNGYILNGEVIWRGEDITDIGTIKVVDNKVETVHGKFSEKFI